MSGLTSPLESTRSQNAAILVFVLVVAYAIYQYFVYQRLAQFKGPLWASLTELWLAKVTWESRIHTELREINDRYGKATYVHRVGR